MGIHLYRQLNIGIPEIRKIDAAASLPKIIDSFSSFIAQTENDIQNLELKLEKLRFIKQHIANISAGLSTCSIQQLPNLYLLYQQDFSKTLYENMKDVFNSPIFSFGNFCYTLRTNTVGTYSPHALEFAIREPMFRVCPWNDKKDTFRKVESCNCIYTVITAPNLDGVEWDLANAFSFATENGLRCSEEFYAFYVYSLIAGEQIIDYYEVYIPIIG